MIVIGDKVVLHLQKCAGSSVRWSLINAGFKYRFSCEHAHIKMLPKMYTDYPRIAFIRNPVDWYRSFYYHVYNNHKKNTALSCLLHTLSDKFREDIDGFVYNAIFMEDFFNDDNNMSKLKERIRYIVMNKYNCAQAYMWDDVDAITSDDLKGTYLDHKYTTIGLDTAKVYRIEDGIHNALKKEFGVSAVMQKNRTNYTNAKQMSHESKSLINKHDKKYFDMYNY